MEARYRFGEVDGRWVSDEDEKPEVYPLALNLKYWRAL